MSDFSLKCEDFQDGEEIPKNCGYKHGNREPEISIRGLHDGIKTLAIIMDDPDAMAAVGKVWVHWLMYEHYFPEVHSPVLGKTDFGEIGYGGPAPPDKRHTYVFKLYALDTELDLPQKSTKVDVEKAMEGHIIEQTQLTGTYAP